VATASRRSLIFILIRMILNRPGKILFEIQALVGPGENSSDLSPAPDCISVLRTSFAEVLVVVKIEMPVHFDGFGNAGP
jgi:hypothetical protein